MEDISKQGIETLLAIKKAKDKESVEVLLEIIKEVSNVSLNITKYQCFTGLKLRTEKNSLNKTLKELMNHFADTYPEEHKAYIKIILGQ